MSGYGIDGDDAGKDPIDEANARAENFREGLLKSGNWRKPTAPTATGECLYCTAPLPPHRRWCNAECRDGWEEDRKRAQRGRLDD